MSSKRAQQWCQSKGDLKFFETSAKDAHNVDSLFETVCHEAIACESNDMSDVYGDFPDQIRLTDLTEPPTEKCSCWVVFSEISFIMHKCRCVLITTAFCYSICDLMNGVN